MPTPAECLVLFDCDGVLVDSERLAVAIDVRVMGTLGWQFTEAEAVPGITTVLTDMADLPEIVRRALC